MHKLLRLSVISPPKIALARVSGQDISKLEEQRRIHEQNLTALADKPAIAPERLERPTGETFAERWNRLDWNNRNDLMRRNGIKLWAKKEADGHVSVVAGPDLETFEGGEFFKTLHDLTTIRS